MDAASAALSSWNLDPRVIFCLLLISAVYVRGWQRGRQLIRDERDSGRLAAFLGGVAAVFLATESPLDTFDNLFLSAHMTQHILLLMIAPLLILLGHPMLPFLRGLPRPFVKEGLGPFLAWRALRRLGGWLVSPPVAWLAFAISTIAWHVPKLYELALGSPAWHEVQHACFFWTGILFWWPVVQPGPGKPRSPRWVAIPYLALSDGLNTALSAFFVFSGKLLYPSYAAIRASGMSPMDDQTLAGAIMWVPGSILYLVPAIAIAVSLLSNTRLRRRPAMIRVKRGGSGPSAMQRLHLPQWRRTAQVAMLLAAVAVIADGFCGPRVAPLNLAGVLPWVHWRGLSILALLVVGNLFCMACPFTLVRDMARKIMPAKMRWPRVLRNKWPAIGLLVIYLWTYEAFGLWDSPWLTAAVMVGYFVAAVIVDGIFRGASFCKYVCPIGQFHFVSSLISPGQIAVRSEKVCKSCQTHDCIRGNERFKKPRKTVAASAAPRKETADFRAVSGRASAPFARSRGCELYLFQPKKAGNFDCTFCLDCVKACPHDNVALLPAGPGTTLLEDPYRSSIGRLSKRTDWAVLALVVVFGAFVNAAGMIAPVMMWEHGWHARLGPHMMPVIVGAFVAMGVIVAPILAMLVCAGFNRLSGLRADLQAAARRFAFSLVPVGFAMWAAHLLYHFSTAWDAPKIAIQRIVSGVVTTMPMPFVPQWLASAQILLLDAGLLVTLYIAWRIAGQFAATARSRAGVVAPWAALSCVLYVLGVVILLQPMQMRGMVH